MNARFSRYQLRTTDLDGARSFYEAVVGPGFWDGPVSLAPLPEPARAAGRPPHWLGVIGTSAVDQAVAAVLARGGSRRGPPGLPAVLRDPFGAMFGLGAEPPPAERGPVAWHLMAATDEAAAVAAYAEWFGWSADGAVDLGPQGRHVTFAWEAGGPTAGSFTDLARRPGIHTQWLYFFEVPDLALALGAARAGGGLTLEPTTTATGSRLCPCDDPQGGAFGLIQL